jgi:hypothetical protein
VVIAAVAICMGCLFLTTYSLALGDPVPHRIDAGIVGNPATQPKTVDAVQGVAGGTLAFRAYPSVSVALHAIDEQRVYAALDLTSSRPTLYVASAAGASVARVLEKITGVDPSVRVVDAHPLASRDPNGVDLFYLMLVATIIGFLTVFQVTANAPDLALRHHVAFYLALALAASLALTVVDDVLLHRLHLRNVEEWGILALHLLAVSSFASLMTVLVKRWAVVPTWLFFVVLGNASSGGAVSPPLLPQPFAFLSNWLPSGATVTSVRNIIYFHHYQHAQPILVLASWAVGLFAAWVLVARRRETSTSPPDPAVASAAPARDPDPEYDRAAQGQAAERR